MSEPIIIVIVSILAVALIIERFRTRRLRQFAVANYQRGLERGRSAGLYTEIMVDGVPCMITSISHREGMPGESPQIQFSGFDKATIDEAQRWSSTPPERT